MPAACDTQSLFPWLRAADVDNDIAMTRPSRSAIPRARGCIYRPSVRAQRGALVSEWSSPASTITTCTRMLTRGFALYLSLCGVMASHAVLGTQLSGGRKLLAATGTTVSYVKGGIAVFISVVEKVDGCAPNGPVENILSAGHTLRDEEVQGSWVRGRRH